MSLDIAITGLGVVSCCGNGIDKFWNNIQQGISGIGPIENFKPTVIKTTKVGEVKNFKLSTVFDPKWQNKVDRHVHFALNCVHEALTMSGLDLSAEDPSRIHTVIGTCAGSYNFIVENQQRIDQGEPASPKFIPGHINNMTSAYINMHYGIEGSGLAIAGACAAGNQAIAIGAMLIETGQADIVIAGASDSWLSEVAISGFESLRALSYDDILPRPFDSNRNGFAISEGAGILILESKEHAQRRGATILSYLSGYGISSDAYHPTSPEPTNRILIRTINQALSRAKINADQINYINAHATATRVGDSIECQGLYRIFGNRPMISSTKSMTGHSIGSTSAIEAVIGVLSICNNTVPGTINLQNIDPECPGNLVTETQDATVNHVLSNSFGFGGTNGILIFSK